MSAERRESRRCRALLARGSRGYNSANRGAPRLCRGAPNVWGTCGPCRGFAYARNRGAPRVSRGAPNVWGLAGRVAASHTREIEERHGFPGALRTFGRLAGRVAASHTREIEERHGFHGALRTVGGAGPFRGAE